MTDNYVPKKGDIVVFDSDLSIDEQVAAWILNDELIASYPEDARFFKLKRVGLSLERIESEYITKDDANIREIMAYESGLTEGYNKWGVDERIKRDEKLIQKLFDGLIGCNTLKELGERKKYILKVFAEVDK